MSDSLELQRLRHARALKECLAALRRAQRPNPALLGRKQCVYFIQAGDDGPIKVGRALYPLARMKELQIGSATKLAVIAATQPVPSASILEVCFHQQFRHDQMQGEWFRYSTMLHAVADAVCFGPESGLEMVSAG